ncbi:alpha/beta hydrolase family protein [Roseateles toxinivorans]|uniref:Putative dienelactone hydrolase n=1 Tax=Roseateles toxinivorans TaxID=270368 RepID=A0A4R6QG51_9BURK|nr:dienelactone hydrolase family protein [Roseateles toxinivorans]TDP61297.1 putative dienelactone hydrolase [Roseateles toxinivorans]
MTALPFNRYARRMRVALVALVVGVANAAPIDAPELATPGGLAVGVMKLSVDVGRIPAPDGKVAEDRKIDAWLWYPTSGAPGTQRELTRDITAHAWRPLPKSPLSVSVPSVATPEAPPLPGARLPVVVISHGLLNWAPMMNYLAEHLASRGYAVLGLEHNDEAASNPLASALLLRPLDDGAALRMLQSLDATPGHVLHQRLALDKVGLVGYSMGGYGALISAGARVANDGMAYNYVPGGVMARHAGPLQGEDEQARARIGAVVTIAPWGGQSFIGAFKPAGLAGVKVPLLALVGDQDDISGYADGVRSLWEQLPAAPRWLLVYENARHNIAQHGAPAPLQGTFASWTSFDEPVWRRDRILDINRHFITAFLDLTLLGRADRAVYLNPVVPRSNDGAWPEPQGTPATGRFAGAPQGPITHWAGFQRRWALGLRLEQRTDTPVKP